MDLLQEAFNNAPTELREKGIRHNEAFKRNTRAEKQYRLWKTEVELSRKLFEVTLDDFNEVMSRYDSDSNSLKGGDKEDLGNDAGFQPVAKDEK